MVKAAPARLRRRLSPAVLAMLQITCDGQWDRVTIDGDGSPVVHNQPQVESAPPVARKKAPPAEPVAAGPTPMVLAGLTRTPPVALVADRTFEQVRERATPRRDSEPVAPAEPVREVLEPAPPVVKHRPQPPPALDPEDPWASGSAIVIPGVVTASDWALADLPRAAHALLKQLQHGVPPECPIIFHGDVTAMHGVDLDAAVAAARHPDRVEINPGTATNKYGVLTFRRGDVITVIGFLNPREVKVIACYFTGEALKEHQGGKEKQTGGGGSRNGEGIPRNPGALTTRLQAMGATVTEDSGKNGDQKKTATVTYGGKPVGKITVDPWKRAEVEKDWQRCQRIIHALKQRDAKGA